MLKVYQRIICLCLFAMLANIAVAADFTVDYLRYEYNSDRTAVYLSGASTTEIYYCIVPHQIVSSNKTYIVEGVNSFGIKKTLHLVLSEGLEYVNADAFKASTLLKTISLPSTLTQIGSSAFAGLSNLEIVYAFYYDPPVIDNSVFRGSTSSATLHVPKGAIANYTSKVGWNSFTIVDDLLPCLNGSGDTVVVEKPIFDFNLMSGNFVIGAINEPTLIPVNIRNSEEVLQCQLSIKLPERIELVDDVDTFIEGTERGADIDFSATQNEDGTITITGTSSTPLEAGDGTVLNLKVKTAWQNTYTIPVTNMTVTTADGNVKQLPDSETCLVMQGVRGDMNGDGRVDLSDALYIINLATGQAE